MSSISHMGMLEAINFYEEEIKKFEDKGNKAAGTRARAALSTIAKFAKMRRLEIQESKNALDVLRKENHRQDVAVAVAAIVEEAPKAKPVTKKK